MNKTGVDMWSMFFAGWCLGALYMFAQTLREIRKNDARLRSMINHPAFRGQ